MQYLDCDRQRDFTNSNTLYNILREEVCNKLLVLKPHLFISKQQTQYFQLKKNNLDEGEILIVLDFNKNYKYAL